MVNSTCSNCGYSRDFEDKHSGRTYRCPKCSSVVRISGPAKEPLSEPKEQLQIKSELDSADASGLPSLPRNVPDVGKGMSGAAGARKVAEPSGGRKVMAAVLVIGALLALPLWFVFQPYENDYDYSSAFVEDSPNPDLILNPAIQDAEVSSRGEIPKLAQQPVTSSRPISKNDDNWLVLRRDNSSNGFQIVDDHLEFNGAYIDGLWVASDANSVRLSKGMENNRYRLCFAAENCMPPDNMILYLIDLQNRNAARINLSSCPFTWASWAPNGQSVIIGEAYEGSMGLYCVTVKPFSIVSIEIPDGLVVPQGQMISFDLDKIYWSSSQRLEIIATLACNFYSDTPCPDATASKEVKFFYAPGYGSYLN